MLCETEGILWLPLQLQVANPCAIMYQSWRSFQRVLLLVLYTCFQLRYAVLTFLIIYLGFCTVLRPDLGIVLRL